MPMSPTAKEFFFVVFTFVPAVGLFSAMLRKVFRVGELLPFSGLADTRIEGSGADFGVTAANFSTVYMETHGMFLVFNPVTQQLV